MKKIERHIGQAMDRRLSALSASPQCRADIRQRILREEEKLSAKHRLPMRAAVVFAVILLIGSIAAAAAVNVFDLYGREFELLASLSKQSELKNTQPTVIYDEHIGTSAASITNGYYDGTNLFVGFNIENAGCAAEYIPSEQEIAAAMVLEDDGFGYRAMFYDFLHTYFFSREEEYALIDAFEAAIRQGKPYGVIVRRICEDKSYTADGRIVPISNSDDYFANFDEYRIVKNGRMPETLTNSEELSLRISLRKRTTMLYFDGSVFYVDSWDEPLDAAMTAVIPRSERKIVRYEGSGKYRDAEIQASLELAQADGMLTLRADGNIFKEYKYGRDMRLVLADEQGRAFLSDGGDLPDEQTRVVYYIGSMTYPERLTLRLYEEVTYGDYEMVPYGTATERMEVIYEVQLVLEPVG